MKKILSLLVLIFYFFAGCSNNETIVTPESPQPTVISDIALGDGNTFYFNIEFSPDMQYMTFTELVGGANNIARDWMCVMDKSTGTLGGDGTGKQYLLYERTGYSPDKQINPQWGVDAQGQFSVTLDNSGKFLIFRPNGNNAPTLTTLSTPSNNTRFLPYPARVPNRNSSLIAYTQRDPQNRIQIWVIDMANPNNEMQITSGNLGVYSGTNSSPITLSIQRWFWPVPGAGSNTSGLPEMIYGFMNSNNKLQIRSANFTTGSPVITDVTNDIYDHIDDFTAVMNNEKYLLGGINNSGEGRLYKFNGNLYTEQQSIKPTPQTFLNATTCSSFEIFNWKGKYYALYQILDNNTSALPTGANQETWVCSLLETDVNFMVTPKTANVRLDPEFYLANEKLFIFYSARLPNGKRELRKAEINL
ncbi:MAG: hypothetical protein SFU91_04905 [Chloroherpetonaceae bacterium]|nr:hypothetical protein [Chloroherpetonaceae bacterium]